MNWPCEDCETGVARQPDRSKLWAARMAVVSRLSLFLFLLAIGFLQIRVPPVMAEKVSRGFDANNVLTGSEPYWAKPGLIDDIVGRGIRPEIYGARGDGVVDDAPALAWACNAAASMGVPLSLKGIYRLATDRALTCDIAFSARAMLRPDRGKVATLTGAIYAAASQQVFAGPGTVVAATAPWVSVAWWGGLAAANARTDAMPAIRAAFGPNRTIYFPPATYTCESTVPSPYPSVAGPQCAWFAKADDWTVEANGAVLTADASHDNGSLLGIDYGNHIQVRGLQLRGNPRGLPRGAEPSGFFIVHLRNFLFKDIVFTGNWGGSTRQPFAFVGDWLSDGHFARIRMPAISGCFDVAFLRRITFTKVIAVGAADNGSASTASRVACLNVEDDVRFRTRYPAATIFTKTSNVTVDATNDWSNFSAGAFLRAGGPFLLAGRFHDNPAGDSILENAAGAGVILYNSIARCCSSARDPLHDVTLAGQFSSNGARAAGAGIIIDAHQVAVAERITNIVIAGSVFDNNTNAAVKTIGPANVKGLLLGSNQLRGIDQTVGYDRNTILVASRTKNRAAMPNALERRPFEQSHSR
jgi:hypothetical protein